MLKFSVLMLRPFRKVVISLDLQFELTYHPYCQSQTDCCNTYLRRQFCKNQELVLSLTMEKICPNK